MDAPGCTLHVARAAGSCAGGSLPLTRASSLPLRSCRRWPDLGRAGAKASCGRAAGGRHQHPRRRRSVHIQRRPPAGRRGIRTSGPTDARPGGGSRLRAQRRGAPRLCVSTRGACTLRAAGPHREGGVGGARVVRRRRRRRQQVPPVPRFSAARCACWCPACPVLCLLALLAHASSSSKAPTEPRPAPGPAPAPKAAVATASGGWWRGCCCGRWARRPATRLRGTQRWWPRSPIWHRWGRACVFLEEKCGALLCWMLRSDAPVGTLMTSPDRSVR